MPRVDCHTISMRMSVLRQERINKLRIAMRALADDESTPHRVRAAAETALREDGQLQDAMVNRATADLD